MIDAQPRRNKILLWFMTKYTTNTDRRWNEDGMWNIGEQNNLEEDVWLEGYTVQEGRGYKPTQNNRVEQKHPRRRNATYRTETNKGGKLGVSELTRGSPNPSEGRTCARSSENVTGEVSDKEEHTVPFEPRRRRARTRGCG